MKIEIDTKKLPFFMNKTKDGYVCGVNKTLPNYWGDTPEEALKEFFEGVISSWQYDSIKYYEIRNLLGIR